MRADILTWYRDRGRPLAFRRTADPYAILVSETMAQQTQASRAADYWEAFMVRFPTVESLANASPADVLRAWAGLGYDRRALALRRAARIIVDRHGGTVPSDVAMLEALPGVGPYTARAVAALAFGAPVGAVDVNVRRVLGRALVDPAAPLPPSRFQALADAAVPPDQPATWTHALMDVGATLCRARAPRCTDCPVRPWCRYAAAAAPAAADGPPIAPARRPAPTSQPFEATNRWLRGRILERVRAVPDGTWVSFDRAIGGHGRPRVDAALTAMASDGLIELERPVDPRAAGLRARLALS
jgi:A/G-specific adenine glycosylase